MTLGVEVDTTVDKRGDLIVTFFFPWAIDLCVSPDYGEVESFDLYKVLESIGITQRNFVAFDGNQNEHKSYDTNLMFVHSLITKKILL